LKDRKLEIEAHLERARLELDQVKDDHLVAIAQLVGSVVYLQFNGGRKGKCWKKKIGCKKRHSNGLLTFSAHPKKC
jgi:hypothetical protein